MAIIFTDSIRFKNIEHERNRDEVIENLNKSLSFASSFPNYDVHIIGNLSDSDVISILTGKDRDKILELITIYESKGQLAKWKSKDSGKEQNQSANHIRNQIGLKYSDSSWAQFMGTIRKQYKILTNEKTKYKFNIVQYTMFGD